MRFFRNGYARSPYIHNWLPFAECENYLNSPIRLDSLNIAASRFLPSMGPKRFVINLFGVTTDWNLTARSLLSPLNKGLWNSPGLHMFTKVPSTNLQQFCKGGLSGSIVQENLEIAKFDLMLWTSSYNGQIYDSIPGLI